jgi:hypothetical protein
MNKLKIVIVTIFFSLTGCEEYLDKAPELGLTEEDVFLKFESARGFLDVNYDKLVDMHHWDGQNLRNNNITSLSDETASVVSHGSITELNTGNWLNQPWMGEVGWTERGVTRRSSVIGRAFSGLRISNKVIENAEMIPNITEEQLNGLLGQAYFFRAWWYFQIILRWGGMSIFDKVFAPNDNMDLERKTYSESSEWLISDLDKAIAFLPHNWADEEYGRATKGSAMALRSMVALYASSPLMKNDLYSLQNNGYDIAWAEKAALYAHEAIEYVQNGTGGHGYRLMNKDEYKNIFYHDTWASDESLWFRIDGNTRVYRDFTTMYFPRRIGNMSGKGNSAMNFSNPTQNIVELYETADGYPVDHASSGYDPQDPFLNRDPRFYNNVVIPGEQWGLNKRNKPIYMETYVNGIDYNQAKNFPSTSDRMISGYGCKKFVWPEANGYTRQWRKNTLNTIYIRVAQLYLDYAEAMNEAYGPNADPKGYGMTAVDAINVIRNRVGMPNVVGEFTGSKEMFRERIRNERSVELMFENHRWPDLRRWMIAEEVFKEPISGLRAHPPAGHKRVANKSTLDFTYEIIPLTTEVRVFSSRQYWYPVAQDHVENLYNFQQNPGW